MLWRMLSGASIADVVDAGCPVARLAGARFAAARLAGARFTGVRLTEALFAGATLFALLAAVVAFLPPDVAVVLAVLALVLLARVVMSSQGSQQMVSVIVLQLIARFVGEERVLAS
ncbi:MAG: pentapeptide repeat-containing protein [Kiloniellales bacterium]